MVATVYTPSPALNTDDINPNTNFRVFVQLSAASNGSLRVRFRANSSGNLDIIGAAFGKWDGVTIGSSSSDMTTAPFRLTFSGSNSATVSANSTLTSDLIAHPGVTFSAGDWVIVTFFCDNSGGANQRYSSGHTTATTMFKAVTSDLSQAQTAAAMGGSVNTVGAVQPGGSGGYNFSVDLVETNDPVSSFLPDPRLIRAMPIWAQ
jgi:hypothetical protein